MAGRGRRFENLEDYTKTLGSLDDFSADLPTLTKKINDINVENVDPALLNNIDNIFKQLCTTKGILNDVLSNLHCEALCDIDFGEKLLIALQKTLYFEVGGVPVRAVLLSCLQADFEEKQSMSKLNHKKFLNAIMLLGTAYKRIKLGGVPVSVLGSALLEYFELLMNGKETNDFKVLVKQILINGPQLSQTKEFAQNYEFLKCNLRNILINQNMPASSRSWIMLAIDFMSNDLKPLTGIVRDFYVKTLGEDYLKLESLIEIYKEESETSSPPKKENSNPSRSINFDPKFKKPNVNKSDMMDRFSDLTMNKSDSNNYRGRKDKIQSPSHIKNTKKENHRWLEDDSTTKNNKGRSPFQHDDRFDKDDDFYGVQLPRRPKADQPKKNANSDQFGTDESPKQESKADDGFD